MDISRRRRLVGELLVEPRCRPEWIAVLGSGGGACRSEADPLEQPRHSTGQARPNQRSRSARLHTAWGVVATLGARSAVGRSATHWRSSAWAAQRVCISTTNPVCSSRAEVRGLPDEDSGAVADDHTLAEDHYARITVELVLRSSGSGDDVWLHNQRLCIGDLIQAGSGSWRVIAEEPPTHVGIHARYICSGA